MGSHHSVPREGRQRTRLVDQRNRLTKPRTNSNANSAPFPAFHPKQGSPHSSKAVRKSMSHRSVNRNSLVLDERLKRRSNSLSLPQPSKQICDDFSWVSESIVRGMDTGVAAASPTSATHQLRRRSTLLAAPPATITRKPISEDVETTTLQDESAKLTALDLAVNTDKSRCTTPSGYSVLGTFKRGSLRITNASPTPTTGTLSPLPTPGGNVGTSPSKVAHAKPKLERRTSSVAVAITTRGSHRNSIRIIPPVQTFRTNGSDPTSPFSFQETPVIDTYAWDIRYANAQLSGLQDSHPFPKPDPKQTPPLSRRSSSPKNIFDEIARRQRALSTSSIPSKPKRPSVVPAPDSGYSSSSSTNSWKPPLTEIPTVITRDTNSRAGAYAALEGNKICPTTAQIIRVRSSPTLRRPVDDYVPEVPHVSRRLCKSPVPEKITGQAYYQRFTRRRSQIVTVESRYWF